MEVFMRNIIDRKAVSALVTMTVSAAAALLLSACAMGAPDLSEVIDFREARFDAISAMREYRNCRDDAMDLAHQPLARHQLDVAAHGLPRHPERQRQIGDTADAAADQRPLVEGLENGRLPVWSQHGSGLGMAVGVS